MGGLFSSRPLRLLLVGAFILAVAGCGSSIGTVLSALTVTTLASGLDIPWGMALIGR